MGISDAKRESSNERASRLNTNVPKFSRLFIVCCHSSSFPFNKHLRILVNGRKRKFFTREHTTRHKHALQHLKLQLRLNLIEEKL